MVPRPADQKARPALERNVLQSNNVLARNHIGWSKCFVEPLPLKRELWRPEFGQVLRRRATVRARKKGSPGLISSDTAPWSGETESRHIRPCLFKYLPTARVRRNAALLIEFEGQEGIPFACPVRKNIAGLPKSVWKWRACPKTTAHELSFHRWRRSGFGWQQKRKTEQKKNLISSFLVGLVGQLVPHFCHLLQNVPMTLFLSLFGETKAFFGKFAILR